MPRKPYISVQELLEDLDGDAELLRNILCDFYEEYRNFRKILRHALEKGELSLASRIAHSMKSGLGTLGWAEGVTMADAIHRLCEEGNRDEARRVLESFDPSLLEMLEEVHREMATLVEILGENS